MLQGGGGTGVGGSMVPQHSRGVGPIASHQYTTAFDYEKVPWGHPVPSFRDASLFLSAAATRNTSEMLWCTT